MNKPQRITHDYQQYSKLYADLGIEGSFLLAFSAVPAILRKHLPTGKRALDHGCGTGRSTRFLARLGYEVEGVDANEDMIQEAKALDPSGNYTCITNDLIPFAAESFDLIFQSIVLLEYGSKESMCCTLTELRKCLKSKGCAVIITPNVENHVSEWASFTRHFPSDRKLKSGDQLRVTFRGRDIELFDYYWTHSDYTDAFEAAGFELAETYRPVADGTEQYQWYDEMELAPYNVDVLKVRNSSR